MQGSRGRTERATSVRKSFVLISEVALLDHLLDMMPCAKSCGSLIYTILMLLATAAALSIQQHQQQHISEKKPHFRDLIEQVLFAPADVQQVFAHIPSMFPSGTYLQVMVSDRSAQRTRFSFYEAQKLFNLVLPQHKLLIEHLIKHYCWLSADWRQYYGQPKRSFSSPSGEVQPPQEGLHGAHPCVLPEAEAEPGQHAQHNFHQCSHQQYVGRRCPDLSGDYLAF